MFQNDLSREFSRTMGCGGQELIRWLQIALPGAILNVEGDGTQGRCEARFPDGRLQLKWRTLVPRTIALLSVPQLEVRFSYEEMALARRQEVQSYFDRATQRGGG